MKLTEPEKERVIAAATVLKEAASPLKVLSHIAWPASVKRKFLADNADHLPEVDYPDFDPQPTIDQVYEARALCEGENPVEDWLRSIGDTLVNTARMMAAAGKADFYQYSHRLFGSPSDPLLDGATRPLDLARMLNDLFNDLMPRDLTLSGEIPTLSAQDLADRLRPRIDKFFGDDAPDVFVEEDLSAKALAGRTRIRLLDGASFSDRDVQQLLQHEAYIHVATGMNGGGQDRMPILGASHAGTTKTQEGLAVFSEMVSGAMDPVRLHRLADRVIGVQMAIDGADFIDLYRFFLEKHDDPSHSFDNARRIMRGGVIKGGAPFTKDIVYLEGLLRVNNFLHAAVVAGRSDMIRLLFCGKLDLHDMHAIGILYDNGLIDPAKYMPPWAADLRFLISHLAYTAFLNNMDHAPIYEHFDAVFAETPVVG